MDPSPRSLEKPSLQYQTPRRRLPGPSVWLGVPAVVFAVLSIVLLVFVMMPDWFSDGVTDLLWQAFGNSAERVTASPAIAWFLGLLLGFAGMYLPKGNRLLPALALLLCVLGLATGGILEILHL